MAEMPDRYLGDGVMASFDGYQLCLWLDGIPNTRPIYLEPTTYAALVDYVAQIKAHYAKEGPDA